jgi:hypothetical protein
MRSRVAPSYGPARGVLYAHDGPGARTRSGGRNPRVPIDAPRPHRDARPVHGRPQRSRSVPFATIAQRINVYAVRDYVSIIDHLVKAWNIAGQSVTGGAARVQDEVCRQAERYERMADRTAVALRRQKPVAFRWLRDRKV